MTPNGYPENDAAFSYSGHELDIFSHAVIWKGYWSSKLKPFFGKNVLEVGAGTGTNTLLLANDQHERWVCLEPDASLVDRLTHAVGQLQSKPKKCEVVQGMLPDVAA